jgi:predicted transcriptional regulator
MIRTQLYLDEAVHRRLQTLARRQGRTVSDLVRDALLRAYGPPHADERAVTLRAIEGLWRDRDDLRDSAAYVRRLRRDTHRLRRPRR